METDTKLAAVREAMRTGDWDLALKLASRFDRLGEHKEAIERAAAALANPQFYSQIGRDVSELRASGITALKMRFDKSWDAVGSDTGIENGKSKSGD
ncbi:MAG: hypothetical protein JJ938_03005 [Roseicyclus sp.]|nr:hypothetical protein [Roseicyclus sp.]MBO6922219.1 hypothetical protein [Roseicyclus sp.]